MSPISELTAKNLSLDELALRLRDHDDVAVRFFAEKVIAAIDRSELPDSPDREEF